MVTSVRSEVRRSLSKVGSDLALARRKRRLTTAMMSERLAVAKSTYARVEKGDPTVSMGVYAMTLFVLGFGDVLGGRCRKATVSGSEPCPTTCRPEAA